MANTKQDDRFQAVNAQEVGTSLSSEVSFLLHPDQHPIKNPAFTC